MNDICQSCGMIISDSSLYGTHGDGHPNHDFCIHCYKDGFFSTHSLDEQIAVNTSPDGLADYNKATGQDISEAEARNVLASYLPGLKRWMPRLEQASWILDRCGYVMLATVSEDGFPRPVAIDVIHHTGINEIWMTTSYSSEKVRHLLLDNKAGLSFVHEADSVSLTGICDVIKDREVLHRFWQEPFRRYFPSGPDDENYCLLRFRTEKAKLWIDGYASSIDDMASVEPCR